LVLGVIAGRFEADAEAVEGFVAGWRGFQVAWLRGGLDPAFLAQGGRELGAEVWSSDARVLAGEGERAAGRLGGQLDSELGRAADGFWAELELPFAVSGFKRSRLDEVVHQSDADLVKRWTGEGPGPPGRAAAAPASRSARW
jgi:hypothetical protein